MDTNTKSVRFGTKQEAVITPKEGYEIDTVTVINTVDNSIVPSEVVKTSENPAQWVCTFVQPAGHVTIRPSIKPILYSVSFEVTDTCNIVLVEQDSTADILIKSSVEEDDAENAGASNVENAAEDENKEAADFKNPQHSFNDDASGALDVGENKAKKNVKSSDTPDTEAFTEVVPDDNNDVQYDPGEFSEELEEIIPTKITQQEYDKKNTLYWEWKGEYDAGRCSKEKFLEIKKKHLQFIEDINTGKIIVE